MNEVTHTKITEIYENFLSKINDYGLLKADVTIEEIEEELFGYFKSARARFYKCKQSLVLYKDEITSETIIESQLTDFEIEIITILMLSEYMTKELLSSETIKQSLSDKDFKIYSQANQLRELRLLKREVKTEASKLINEYTFFDLDKEKM